MLAVAAVLAVLAPQPESWAVAAIARYYFQGNKPSFHQVYLSTLDGSRRKALTHGPGNRKSVSWLGPDRLVWIEGKRIVEYSLRTGKSSTVATATGQQTFSWDSLDRLRGTVQYEVVGAKKTLVGSSHGWTYRARTQEDDWPESNGATNVPLLEHHSISLGKFGVLRVDGEREAKYTLVTGSGSAPFPAIEGALTAYRHRGLVLHVTTSFFSADRRPQKSVYRVDLRSGSCRLLFDGLDQIDFVSSRRYWCGIQDSREVEKLPDGRQVWVSYGYVGDLSTGKSWIVTPGPVHADSIAIRPN